MSYIDGFMAAVPDGAKDDPLGFARSVAQVLREHGALEVVDAWGEDVPDGRRMIFGGFTLLHRG